jgi:predicted dithiol-disulfide oxidoreductase (DUF899 family)
MQYDVGQRRLLSLRDKIRNLRAEMRAVTAAIEPQPVADHVFGTLKGSTTLSALFEGRDDLIVIHNMGSKCAYCTMWADGYSGLYPHLKQRAAFVVASPDMPKTQAKFAASRGWQFPMVSDKAAAFAARMGYVTEEGRCLPGISIFQLRSGQIVRVNESSSCPHDDFCALWHLFDLLPAGSEHFAPSLSYAVKS